MVKRVRLSKQKSPSDDFVDIGSRSNRRKLLKELESALVIDRNSLDEEIARQSEIFYQVAKIVAILASRRDQAKKEKEEIEAEVDINIREEAARRDTKITEKHIDAKKVVDDQVISKTHEVLALTEELHIWGALKEAYGQRNYMLKEITELYITQYFSEQSVTGESPVGRYKSIEAGRARNAMRGERKKHSERS